MLIGLGAKLPRLLNRIACILCLVGTRQAAARCAEPLLVVGIDQGGAPTSEWLGAIRDRVDAETLMRIQASPRPFTQAEQAWAGLVEREAPTLCASAESINPAFRDIRPPQRVRLLIGNQAGDDAFTAGADTIVLDLSSFVRAYGSSDGQAALVDRVLTHEYTHLLLHPYLDRIGWSEQWAERDPFLRALRVLFNEGIANMSSIEDPKWIGPGGELTPFARGTVAALEVTMLQRLQQLEANPRPEKARELLRNISQGKLTQKWGAVPIALWLRAETGRSPDELRKWIERRPDGILALAVHHADPALRLPFQHLLEAVPSHVALAGKKSRSQAGTVWMINSFSSAVTSRAR